MTSPRIDDDTVVRERIPYQGPARTLLGAPGEYYAITTQPFIDDDTGA